LAATTRAGGSSNGEKSRNRVDGRSPINAPHWQGEDLAGRDIVVYGEFHFGDIIQFVRFLPLLSRRGAKVSLACHNKLTRLFRALKPNVSFLDPSEARRPFDFQCALMSLPLWLGIELSSVPNQTPYLAAEENLVIHWKNKVGARGFKIGIAWEGRPQRAVDRRKFALAEFAPLARIPGVRLISLQKEFGVEQLEELPAGLTVETLGEFDDGPDAFIDTAAVMESLDLIVTSDTSIAHLAGALGRPTWVALKNVPDWRWLLDRDDSPWYPTLRLFRQETSGDWTSVLANMERELRSLVLTDARLP
jgi:hypothetical protein